VPSRKPQPETPPPPGKAIIRLRLWGLLSHGLLYLGLLFPAPAAANGPQDCGRLLPYKSSFVQVGYDTLAPPERHHREIIFDFSFQYETCFLPMLHIGYSQHSFWQFFDEKRSSPFRETNYNPEIFYRRRFGYSERIKGRPGLQAGFEHESNGRGPTVDEYGNNVNMSRSWDRGYVWAWWKNGREGPFVIGLKWWQRKKEQDKRDPLAPLGDDNPQIEDFTGKGEFYLGFSTSERAGLLIMMRKGRRDHHGTVRMEYIFNSGIEGGYMQLIYFSGYGESLIDYDRRVERYGLGMSFHGMLSMF